MISKERKPVLYALAAAVLFGCNAPIAKLLLEGTEPIILASFLYLGSGCGLLLFLLASRIAGKSRYHVEASLQKRDLLWLGGMILCGGVIAPVILLASMHTTPATTAALLLNFEAVATTVFAATLFGESVGRRIWMALFCITTSCIILTWHPEAAFGFSISAIGVLVATIFWSLDNNFTQKISSRDPIPSIMVKGIFSGLITLIIAMVLGEQLPSFSHGIMTMVLGFLSFGGFISVLFFMALRGIGTARTGSLLATSPLFGVIFSLLLFAEIPGILFYVSAPIMALGSWLLISEKHAHPHHHPPVIHEHRHHHDDLHHDHEHIEGVPPLSNGGEHSHLHGHGELYHDHAHRPDLHHRHTH